MRKQQSFCSESKDKDIKEDWKFDIKKLYSSEIKYNTKLTNLYDKSIQGRR